MTKHYYAFFHTYGIRTVSSSNFPIGELQRFDSESERDAWVRAERYEGNNVHRESIDSRLAREFLELVFMSAWDLDVASILGRDAPYERGFWRRAATIDQLWNIYKR